jgi:hypothetical protein
MMFLDFGFDIFRSPETIAQYKHPLHYVNFVFYLDSKGLQHSHLVCWNASSLAVYLSALVYLRSGRRTELGFLI